MSKRFSQMAFWAALTLGDAAPISVMAAEGERPSDGIAFYEITMQSADPESGIVAASGRVVDSLTQTSCAQQKNETEMVFQLDLASGGSVSQTAKSTYLEEGDRLTFESRLEMNGVVADASRGTAARQADGSVAVTLQTPTERQVEVAGPIVFPIAMARQAVAAALAGSDRLELDLYDGLGGGDLVHSIIVTIGEPSVDPVPGVDPAILDRLGVAGKRHWPMRFTSFLRAGNVDQTPEFTISSHVFENGFGLASVYDFGAFAMRLELVDFQKIEPEPCPTLQ